MYPDELLKAMADGQFLYGRLDDLGPVIVFICPKCRESSMPCQYDPRSDSREAQAFIWKRHNLSCEGTWVKSLFRPHPLISPSASGPRTGRNSGIAREPLS